MTVYKKLFRPLFSCFVRLAEGFEVKRNQEMEVGEISQYFPHFIWLLRDVSLLTSDDGQGGEMDPTDYIKQKVTNLLILDLFRFLFPKSVSTGSKRDDLYTVIIPFFQNPRT